MWTPTVNLFRWLLLIDRVDDAVPPESTKVVDDDATYEGNDLVLGNTQQWMPTWRGV